MSSRARSKSCRSFCQYFSSSFTALVFSSCSFCKAAQWGEMKNVAGFLRVLLFLGIPCESLSQSFSCLLISCSDYVLSFLQHLANKHNISFSGFYIICKVRPKSYCSYALGTHFSACSCTPSLLLYTSSLQRLEILSVGCCASKRQRKAFTV